MAMTKQVKLRCFLQKTNVPVALEKKKREGEEPINIKSDSCRRPAGFAEGRDEESTCHYH